MNPKRWHVYIVESEPTVKTKPSKKRPYLCIQPTEITEAGLKSCVILPLTTKIHKENTFPFRVKIPKGTCALGNDSEVVIDQILAWDKAMIKEDLGLIPEHIQERVKEALIDFLDL